MKQLPAPERPVILDPFPRCLQGGDITLHAAQRQLGQLRWAEFNIKMDKRFGGDLVRVSIFCKMG